MTKPRDPAETSTLDSFEELLGRAARLSPVPPALHPRLHPGRELCRGRFEVRGRLGAGGMGVVHEAYDRERGELVAVKTLARLEPSAVYRLKNEFRALAQVTHPNLVHLHELFADGELWLFSMERVRGEPLDLHVRPAGRLDELRLRSALRQLALGVHAIHEAGKLHRDLKPSNVLVTPEGRVVILDFGLVSDPEVGGIGQTLEAERTSGTPAYMAPEQAGGQSAGAASDAYAVGAMLFEALTGALPFDGHVHEILYRKQRERAPRPSASAPSVPPDLDALCEALLAHDPRLRPTLLVVAELAGAPATSARGLSRQSRPRHDGGLIGRLQELELLREALRAAEAGRPAVVCVRGESGLGKTALVSAFLDEVSASGRALVLRGRCHERESVPYKAFDRVVDELSRHLLQLGDEARSVLPRDARALARLFPVLERCDAVAGAPERPSPDESTLRRRAFEAFAELLGRLRDRQPLVVHVDDLQFVDHDSALLLEHLLGMPEPPPLLLVLTERPEPASAPIARVSEALASSRVMEVHALELGPLPAPDATELAERALGPVPHAAALAAAVVHDAQGSPFFVCELVRYAIDAGRLPSDPAVRLERAVDSRLAQLAPGTRELFELLTVSGRPTPSEVLARASDAPEIVPALLDELCAAQLVRFAGAGSYECYHERIRRAALERLDEHAAQGQRQRLIAAYAGSGRDAREALFELCFASGDRAGAAEHAVAAATRAADGLAFERASTFFAHAIALMPEPEVRRRALRVHRAEALSASGRFGEAALAFDEASLADDDPERALASLHRSALCFLGSGQALEGLPRLRRVLGGLSIRWPRSRIGAYLGAASRLLLLWARGPGPSLARDAPRADATERVRMDRLLEAALLLPPYDLARGLLFLAEFVWRALRLADPEYRAVAFGFLSSLLTGMRLGDPRADAWATEAALLARSHQVANLRSVALSLAANTHLLNGRLRSTLELSRESEEALGEAGRTHLLQSWTARFLQAHALLQLGRVREAAARFEHNARLGRELGDELTMVGGSSVLAPLSVDDVAGAEALLARKQAVVAAVGDRGVLRDSTVLESMLLALYQGTGAAHARAVGSAHGAMRFFDASALLACCALQGPADAHCRRIVRSALRGLAADHGQPGRRGTAAQLRAALAHMDGDVQGARQHLLVGAAHYDMAEMALHAALVRLREAELRGDEGGARSADEQLARLRAQGLVRPRAWADMLVPGLAPPPRLDSPPPS